MRKDIAIRTVLAIIGDHEDTIVSDRVSGLELQDWHDLLAVASRHRITPYLYLYLGKRDLSGMVPPEINGCLKAHYLETLATNTRRLHHLRKTIALLKDQGIPVLLLKGAFLAEHIYGDCGARHMTDIDLMIRQSDSRRMLESLEEHGFTSTKENISEIQFYNADQGLLLDTHYNIVNFYSPFSVDPVELWERSVPLPGSDSCSLCLEDHLIHLCYHATYRHVLKDLKNLVDLHVLLTSCQDKINWRQINLTAGRWRLLNCVTLALETITNLTCPAFQIHSELSVPSDPVRRRATSWAVATVLAERGEYLENFKALAKFYSIPGWRGKLRYLVMGTASSARVENEIPENHSRAGNRFFALLKTLHRQLFLARKYGRFLGSLLTSRNGSRRFLVSFRWLAKR